MISNLTFENSTFRKKNNFHLLCAAIIHAGIVIATKAEGKFLITTRCK